MKLCCQKFQLRRSIGLGVIFLFIHVGAIFCVCFVTVNGFEFWVKGILSIWIFANLIWVIRDYILLNRSSSVIMFGVVVDHRGGMVWWLQNLAGNWIEVIIDNPVFASNYLIMINFISKEGCLKKTVPIGRGALYGDDFRRLKVLLRTAR